MKKILYLIPLAALCFSCVKENDAADADSAIRFSAEAFAPETKVSYSGEDDAGKERIEWGVGDCFSVWCNESAVTKVASYSVSGPAADYIDNTGATSTASKVGAVDANNVLEWGASSSYNFYARYPDPTWTAGAPDDVTYTGQTLTNNVFTCVIPATQAPTKDGDTFTYLPQMQYCYMTAYTTAAKKGTVALNFTPVVSCFEISIAHSYIADNEAFTVSKVELISSSKRLNGTYTVTMGASPTITVPDSSSEDDRKITFSPNVTVTSGETLKFTVFTCPVDIEGTDGDHLSVKITLANGDTRTKELKNGGAWLSYAAGGKYRINCGTVPDPYNYNIDTDVDELVIDCQGVEKTATFKVFSTKNKLGLITASPWKAQYSTFDGVTWTEWADMTTGVEDFTLSQYSGDGDINGETITATMPGGDSSSRDEEYSTYHFRSAKGLALNPIDLSLYDTVADLDLENPLSQESANCYIIRAEGYYKIPLSYGNSIKAGAANTSSYTSQILSAESGFKLIGTVADPFVNGLGNAINAENYKISPTASYTVAISTQDTATSSVTDCVESLVIDGDYIKFHVTENINPCNVVIKVTNGETTVWSYHLWMVPNETALEVKDVYKSGSKVFSMLTANLGQTPPSSAHITSYPERSIKLRFVSKMDGSVFSLVMVTRPEKETSKTLGGVVVNPFYQHGRKDPLLSPTTGKEEREKGVSYKGVDTYSAVTGSTITYSVSHPAELMSRVNWPHSSTHLWYISDNDVPYSNMWDTAQTGTANNSNPVKSVYDPSPRGYHVAWKDAFNSMYSNGYTIVNGGGMTFGYIKTVSGGTETLAFPSSGYRNNYSSSSGTLENVGTHGYIWSSASASINTALYCLIFSYFYPANDYYRSVAYSVRPVKD